MQKLTEEIGPRTPSCHSSMILHLAAHVVKAAHHWREIKLFDDILRDHTFQQRRREKEKAQQSNSSIANHDGDNGCFL